MEIKLQIEGKPKTYTLGFVSGRMLRRTLETQKKLKDLTEHSLDEAVDYIVDLYEKRFTRDDFYDGIDASQIFPTIRGCLNAVVARLSQATDAEQADPN